MRTSSFLKLNRHCFPSSLCPWGCQLHLKLQQTVQRHKLSRQKTASRPVNTGGSTSKLEALKYAAGQSSKSLTTQQTLQAVALPPDNVPALGPRVEHIIAKDAGTLSAILSSQLLLPEVIQRRQAESLASGMMHTLSVH